MGFIQNIINWILVKLGIRQPEPKLTRDQSMNAVPIRNPLLQWRRDEDDCIIVAMERREDWVGQAMEWLFMVPPKRKVELDDVGSTVWEACDGENTVNDIVEIVADEYKLSRREVEMSLTKYLRTLGQRKMVGFMIDEEIAEDAGISDDQDVVGLEDVATTEAELKEARRKAEQEAEERQRLLEEDEREREQRRQAASDAEAETEERPADDEPLIEVEDHDRGLRE